jgi:glycosyltransferase involved in cell wall biosynthesis
MRVGLMPALGGGIRALAESGQQSRLIDGYLRPYARAFDGLSYFSYLPETLTEFTEDAELLRRVRLLAPSRARPRGLRALQIPFHHAAELRVCAALRVFQITGVIPALVARARFGIPYVTTYGFWYGALSEPGPKRVLKGLVERLGLRHAAAVIATTPDLAARAARLARRVELIPNGVDTERFRPTAVPKRDGRLRVLYVGRLSPEKNVAALIAAARRLECKASVVLVGAGPLRGALEAQAAAAGVPVEFAGVVDQARLPAVYAAADAFVLASFTEGHPKVLLEAMACGVPCVASDCAGNRSLVTEGETGLLFDPRRPGELAGCLDRVLADRELAAGLARRGRALVERDYDLAALVAREIALVRAVAGG